MPRTVSLSFRVPPEKERLIEALAQATDRPKSWHLEQALDAYIESQAWQIAHIEQGLGELGRGEGVAHEGVARWLETWGADDEGPPPA